MSAKRILGIATVIVVFVAIGLFTWRPWVGSSSQQAQTIRVGYLPIAAGLPLYVALEEGYFEEAGFNIELSRFSSSNELANAGTAGRLDAMMPCALNVHFDIGIVSGTHHQLFGVNMYSDQAPHIVDYLLVRPDAGITSVADLKGKRIAAFPGSVTKIFVEGILRDHGVEPSEYTYIEMGPGNWQAALSSGSVDAASVMEPQAGQIIADGVATVLVEGFFAKLMPNVPLSGHWVTASFASSENEENVKRFVEVFDRAVDFIRANPDSAKAHYLTYTGLREELLSSMQLNDWSKSTEIDLEKIQQFADILAESGAIQENIDASNHVYSAN